MVDRPLVRYQIDLALLVDAERSDAVGGGSQAKDAFQLPILLFQSPEQPRVIVPEDIDAIKRRTLFSVIDIATSDRKTEPVRIGENGIVNAASVVITGGLERFQ